MIALALCGCARKPDPVSVYNEARRSFEEGAVEDAKKRLEALRALWERGTGRDAVRLRLLKVEILQTQSELDEAARLLARGTPDDPDLRVLQNVLWADELSKLGKHAAGLVILDEAAAQASGLKDRQPAVMVKARQGLLHLRLQHQEQGAQLFREALRGAEEIGDHYDAAIALVNLSYLEMQRGAMEAAIRYAESGEKHAGQIHNLRFLGAAVGNQASAYSFLGMMERSRELRDRAISIQRQMNDRFLLQQGLGEMGNLYYRSEDFRGAAVYYRQAYDMARALPGGGASDGSTWAGNLAQVYLRTGNLEEAERWNNQARELKVTARKVQSLAYQDVTAAEILAGRNRLPEAETKLAAVLENTNAGAGVRWSAHALLAKILSSARRFEEADRHFLEALRLIDTERSSFGDAERQISFQARLIGFHQDYVDALMERGDGKQALLAAEGSRARILRERFGQAGGGPAARVEELQRASRKRGAALLSYWIAPRRSWVWVVTPGTVKWFELPEQPALVQLLDRHQAAVERGESDPLRTEAGRRLGDLLLGRVRPLLGPSPKVIVAPDGALNRLNLETLPVDGHYWIEEAEVSVTPSLLCLAAGSTAKPRRSLLPLLAVGDPEQADAHYGKLKFARQELEAVAKEAGGGELLEGAKASPASYLAVKPERFRMIHFAAHAEANRESPLNSAIILSSDGERYRLSVGDVREHPLQADLVTVSACRGAGARAYSGEGMVGFAWGFLQAGARAVVAGLWNVDDESTAALMTAMYGALAAGQPPAAALRTAKLSLLHGRSTWRRPFHWAPFQTYVR